MTGPTAAVRRQVAARDEGRCVCCGAFVVDPESMHAHAQWSIQHRKARGMGGTKDPQVNDPVNLLVLCGSGTTGCHGRVETNRVWGREQGFAVSKWADPAVIPVVHWLHGLAWVTADGWVSVPPGPEGVREVAVRSAVLRAGLVGHVSHAGVELAAGWVAS